MDKNARKNTELLSPAGSLAILKAASNAGADAVYGAGGKFGARAYADNFTEEELLEAIDYLHLRGKRFYLTVNTLLKDHEVQELQEYLNPLYEAGLDGVIVQDLGALRYIRNHFPDLPIHASTQMAVTGAYGAKLMLEKGCSRIVLARELSLEEISHIYQETGAEIECFVHGALCYCYSGQCLFSSMLGGRSGNRGRCAQPCRLPYEVSGKDSGISGRYLLSMKDLCAIDLLPRLIQSGVYSFKIEGRMKQAEYAAGVTGIYRKYLDRYQADPAGYQVEEEDRKRLLDLGNRCGFTDGYYTRQNGKDMITFRKPSHEKGKEILKNPKKTLSAPKEKIKGILRMYQEMPAVLVLNYQDIQVEVTGKEVQPALKQPLTEKAVLERMQKTGNSPFVFEELKAELGESVFLPVGDLNQLRREGLERLQEKILEKYRRREASICRKCTELSVSSEDKRENMELSVSAEDKIENMELSASSEDKRENMELSISAEDKRENMELSASSEDKRENMELSISAEDEKGKAEIPATAKNERKTIKLHVLAETPEQAEAALSQPETDRIYLESFICSRDMLAKQFRLYSARIREAGKECFLALPHIFRKKTACWFSRHWQELAESADGYLARNLEEVQFLKEMGVKSRDIQGDYQLYGYSREAVLAWRELELTHLTLPVELNLKELKKLDCRRGELILYGRQPLMISSQCLHKNTSKCDGRSGVLQMKDRYGKLFPVRNQCSDCCNMIYNVSPLSLLHHVPEIRLLGPEAVRISFTMENRAEAEEIFACYQKAVSSQGDSREKYLQDYTNGHWKRGVE
ncbi:MAG: U32 family peptidase [Lachnospiraceae bacterium]|nr:U32 family peptidase [Lachnospiraceae bacterium]